MPVLARTARPAARAGPSTTLTRTGRCNSHKPLSAFAARALWKPCALAGRSTTMGALEMRSSRAHSSSLLCRLNSLVQLLPACLPACLSSLGFIDCCCRPSKAAHAVKGGQSQTTLHANGHIEPRSRSDIRRLGAAGRKPQNNLGRRNNKKKKKRKKRRSWRAFGN